MYSPIHSSIYQPSDDSFFFVDFLEKYFANLKNKNISYLDLGTGSGILSKVAIKSKIPRQKILASDINKHAVKYVKSKLKISTIHSDLFSSKKFQDKKFDLITFNAPYLPEENLSKKYESKKSQLATTGGKKGDEISLKFIKQAQNHLEKNGKIFLLISSLTPLKNIKKFNPKIIAKKKIFFEELLIIELKN